MVRCPFFEEVVMAFCRAYPVKKMVPSDRVQANCICTDQGFESCALFQEVLARMQNAEAETAPRPERDGESSQDHGGSK
jgi:hypothetical protein